MSSVFNYSSFMSIKENNSLLLFNSTILRTTPSPITFPPIDCIAFLIASNVFPVA